MHTAMDVAVVMPIILTDGINDLPRFLGGGSIIQIDQGLLVNLLVQDGKISSYLFDIKNHGSGLKYKNSKVTGDGVHPE
jgi:hypothetical protein